MSVIDDALSDTFSYIQDGFGSCTDEEFLEMLGTGVIYCPHVELQVSHIVLSQSNNEKIEALHKKIFRNE